MLVSLITSEKLISVSLPNKYYGIYWVTVPNTNDEKINLVSIEADNDKWKLNSNEETVVIDAGRELPYVHLVKNRFYQLLNKKQNKYYVIYCSPIYDESYKRFLLTKNQIIIGKLASSDIMISNDNVSEQHCIISFDNGALKLQDNNSKTGVYVNNRRINGMIKLSSGDVIFICGVKIIPVIKDNKITFVINNPNNMVTFNSKSLSDLYIMDLSSDDSISNDDAVAYTENDYFYKKPRFKEMVSDLNIEIEPPPTKPAPSDMPAILVIGPMVTSSAITLIYAYMTVQNLIRNGNNWATAWPMLSVSALSLMATLVWPVAIRRYTKYKTKKQEKIRQEAYNKYLAEIMELIEKNSASQKQILCTNNPSLVECKKINEAKNSNFWNRKFNDDDFLNVSLGYGNIPMKISVKVPEIHFSVDKDELLEKVSKFGSECPVLENVPITLNLRENRVVASIGEHELNKSFIDRIIFQLTTLHSYDDLKIVILSDQNKEIQKKWEYIKVLPHCWSEDKKIRFYGTTRDEIREICYFLDLELTERINNKEVKNPFYLIITDDYKTIRNFDFIKKVLSIKENTGFGLFIMNDKIFNLPPECKKFININKKCSEMFDNALNSNVQKVDIDFDTEIDYYHYSKLMANIPIESDINKSNLPDKVGFLEMFEVGKIEQLNILNRWKNNNPVNSLQAFIGVDQNGENVSLDLHEKFHGPHGLIAGMTGSGKSEFIATYILSLAVNYDPREVQFVLIDYKGGGLAGVFENKITGVKLPHLIGTITNLDTNEIKRSLSSLDSELKRRQRAFNEVRDKLGDSAIDIYKYQELYRLGVITEPISHLYIICDEFAELKTQQPEFLNRLISISRIGRSLGIHLILATQKPSGVVDDQIWSNSKFRICLRVQEKSDSSEVIKRPDAAFLKNTGRFYMQVGYDEIFLLGQAAWSGKKYVPTEKIKSKIDTSVEFVNNIGYTIKKLEFKNKDDVEHNYGEEIKNVIDHLNELAKIENIKVENLWLDNIPEYVNIDELKQKYNFTKQSFVLNVPFGEYDVPSQQVQRLLSVDFPNDGNILLYGSTGSGKENFLTTLLYSSITSYSPMEVIYYIIDFGSKSLRVFNGIPHIGDIIDSDDFEKIKNLIKLLSVIYEERKALFADFNGEYDIYINNNEEKVPRIVLIINNYDAFLELYGGFEDSLIQLTREGPKFGIHVIITASSSNSVRYKLHQNFNTEYVLQLNNEGEYTNILGNVNKFYPSKIFGRGIFKGDEIYEFQTAMVSSREKVTEYINSVKNSIIDANEMRAMSVPVLPDIVTRDNVLEHIDHSGKVIVGIDKEDLIACEYNFLNNYVNLILSYDIRNIDKLLNPMISQLREFNFYDIIIINCEKIKIDGEGTYYYNNKFKEIYESLDSYLNNENNGNIRPKLCIIIGFDTLKNKLNAKNIDLVSLIEKGYNKELINFVFVEDIDKIKKYEYETWYKNCVTNTEGIFVGNGLADQMSLKISKVDASHRMEIPDNFCYVISHGKPILVKFVEEYNINN